MVCLERRYAMSGNIVISGGSLRSRRLQAPPGRGTRPTAARVREALFAILGTTVVDAHVLDLYAGTGALGIEALSRGAARATFVEEHRLTAAALRAALSDFALTDRAEVLAMDATRAATIVAGPYAIVFVDPPYALGFPALPLERLHARGALAPGSRIVFERPQRAAAPAHPRFVTTREIRYGEVILAFLEVVS